MKQTVVLFLSVMMMACGGSGRSAQGDGEEADSAVLRVAVLPTLDCLPLFLASEHGMFERAGLDVLLVSFQAQMDQDTAIAHGRVQAMATDLVRAERLRQQSVRLSYLTATNASWKLFTSRAARIRQLKQLDDKMLAMTNYSATDMLAELTLDSARLSDERVFRIPVNDLSVRLNMLQNSTMDAVLLPEPQATAARCMKAFELMDASERFGVWLGVVAAREKAFTAEQADAFRKAYDEACDSLNERGLAAYGDLIVRRTGISQQTADSLPSTYVFRHAAQPREQDVQRAKAWLAKKLEKENVEKQPIQ